MTPHSRTILFGGSGFLGTHILRNYPDIISVGRTTPQAPNRHIPVPSLSELDVLRDLDFDRVIFIIGSSDRDHLEKETLRKNEPNAFDYHLTPLLQTLEQLKHYPVQKFIHFSTVLLYDENRISLPVSEHAPIDPYKHRYVLSKYLAEEALKFYARWIPSITLRLSNVYGPSPRQRYDLIYLLCRKLLKDGHAEIWSRRPERDFIYVEDAAHAVVQLLETEYTGTLNLGTGVMTSIGRVVDILQEVSSGTVHSLDRPVPGPMRFQCDMTTIRNLIDWTPRVGIEEGVRRTYETMRSYCV